MTLPELMELIRGRFPAAKYSVRTEILDCPLSGLDVDVELYVWPRNRTIHVKAHSLEDAWDQAQQQDRRDYSRIPETTLPRPLARRERA